MTVRLSLYVCVCVCMRVCVCTSISFGSWQARPGQAKLCVYLYAACPARMWLHLWNPYTNGHIQTSLWLDPSPSCSSRTQTRTRDRNLLFGSITASPSACVQCMRKSFNFLPGKQMRAATADFTFPLKLSTGTHPWQRQIAGSTQRILVSSEAWTALNTRLIWWHNMKMPLCTNCWASYLNLETP